MQHLKKHSTNLSKLIGIFFVGGMMAACGGGSDELNTIRDGNHIPENKSADQSQPTNFQKIGRDFFLDRNDVAGNWLDVTADKSGNITFSTNSFFQYTPFNLSFQTGLPGGPFANGAIQAGVYSIERKEQNKLISIAIPHLTKQVQNIFWTDTKNPNMFGLMAAGNLLKPNSTTWPQKGGAIYKGKAFQYFVDTYSDQPSHGYALFYSDVTAKVDFETKAILIEVSPEAKLLSMSDNSSMKGAPVERFGAQYALTNLDFSQDRLLFLDESNAFLKPYQMAQIVRDIGFFGEDFKELGGFGDVHEIHNNLNSTPTTPIFFTEEYISFAMVKQ